MPHSSFLAVNNPLTIPGPLGALEAIVSRPVANPKKIIGIICHPHPLYGGTMTNKVITTIARSFSELGVWSLRFNFRGVGASAGTYGAGSGEVDDLRAVLKWVGTMFPNYELWLAGFSFGAYVATQVASQEPVAQLVTLAPAITHFNFPEIDKIHCPWLLIMGEQDELVPFPDVVAWVNAHASARIKTIYLPGVSHFFHGHLTELREQLKSALA